MSRAPYMPALAFLLLNGAAVMSMGVSFTYLGRTAHDVAVAVTADVDGRQPAYIDSISPLPPGSINAVSPLPGAARQAPAPAVTAAAPESSIVSITPKPPGEVAAIAAETPAPAMEAVPAVAAQPVTVATPSFETLAGPEQAVMVVTSAVNVRDRPSNDSRVVGTLAGGTRIAVSSEQGGWYRVEAGGSGGWVYERFLRPGG